MRVSGPFEILSKRLLLCHTGHSRRHALRVMMGMSVMEVQLAHLSFRVASEQVEVNLLDSRAFSTGESKARMLDASRLLSYSSAVKHTAKEGDL